MCYAVRIVPTSPPTCDAPWTIARLLTWTTEHLARHGVEDPRLATEVLLAQSAGWRRIDLYARFERTMEPDALARFREWVRRAANHEPIAYLVGQREFFSLPFKITPDVLIPRPETETLVECLLDHCGKVGWGEARILDVGTGSGCLVIAALVNLQGASAVGTDVSAAAIEVARANAERHAVADRLKLFVADRLSLPPDAIPTSGFDVLVCNPPYIPAETIPTLDRAVRDFEPAMALTDGGDGLSFYRNLASDAPSLLSPNGVIIVEVPDGGMRAVVEIMTQGGSFILQRAQPDRVVGHERALVFSRV